MKAGQPFELQVGFTGVPVPDVTWDVGGKTAVASEKLTIDNKENQSHLTCRRSERTDAGRYTLTLKNDSGKDSGSCNVIVLGKKYFFTLLHVHANSNISYIAFCETVT